MSELRACEVDGETGAFHFHCWSQVSEIVPPSVMVGGHSGGVIADTFGVVEDEKGRVHRVRPEKIRFTDKEKI